MTETEFAEMCRKHDLTYNFSDDGGVWRKGQRSMDAIVEAAKKFDRATAVRIWNEEVDKKFGGDANAAIFYWK